MLLIADGCFGVYVSLGCVIWYFRYGSWETLHDGKGINNKCSPFVCVRVRVSTPDPISEFEFWQVHQTCQNYNVKVGQEYTARVKIRAKVGIMRVDRKTSVGFHHGNGTRYNAMYSKLYILSLILAISVFFCLRMEVHE